MHKLQRQHKEENDRLLGTQENNSFQVEEQQENKELDITGAIIDGEWMVKMQVKGGLIWDIYCKRVCDLIVGNLERQRREAEAGGRKMSSQEAIRIDTKGGTNQVS